MKPKLEVVPHQLNSSIHTFYYQKQHFEAPWHYHKELELVYIYQSTGIRYVGNGIGNFLPGDLVLIGSSLPHVWKNAPEYNSGATSVYTQWNPEVLGPFLDHIAEFHSIRKLLDNADKGLRFPTSDKTRALGSQIQSLLQLKGTPKILMFIDILYQLTRIKDVEVLSGADNHFVKNEETDHRIKDIMDYIDSNYAHKITMQDMADVTFMTRVSFCKFFKKQFYKTFTQYLNEFRVRKACQQLQETNYQVARVALECGYENLAFFHRQFRKYTDFSPAKYRIRFRNIL